MGVGFVLEPFDGAAQQLFGAPEGDADGRRHLAHLEAEGEAEVEDVLVAHGKAAHGGAEGDPLDERRRLDGQLDRIDVHQLEPLAPVIAAAVADRTGQIRLRLEDAVEAEVRQKRVVHDVGRVLRRHLEAPGDGEEARCESLVKSFCVVHYLWSRGGDQSPLPGG